MAILNERSRIYPGEDFFQALDTASRGVLLVHASPPSNSEAEGSFRRALGTAWLITETLAVAPRHMFDPEFQGSYHCRVFGEVDILFEAEPMLDSSDLRPVSPVLLRLSDSLPDRALTLATAAQREGDPVFLLHYAYGIPRLQISFGIASFGFEEQFITESLRYDADTVGGSGGAPIFNDSWELVGVHAGRENAQMPSYNWGFPLSVIFEGLRETPQWAEIAQFHRLADVHVAKAAVQAMREAPPPAPQGEGLLRAAVQWSFDPASFTQEERDQLRPLVIDASQEIWFLRADERKRLIDFAESLDVLRDSRGDEPAYGLGQEVIDRILAGPPYKLDDLTERDLPYWLQAVRWFADVEPALPAPKEINDTLERRRVRSRLEGVAGPDFRGRDAELEKLNTWFADKQSGPMMIHGIGGIGKSALVGKFALQLDQNTPILWLDFDRADIAPDDAHSVLRLLSEQMSVQVSGFNMPEIDPDKPWKEQAEYFSLELAQKTLFKPLPLLVLDGFEVAQYVQRYQEIWGLLESVLLLMPGLRILVSGRARVVDLKLNGRPAESLELAGLAPEVAKEWLKEGGIEDTAVLDQILDAARGVPLVLLLIMQLARQLKEKEEDLVKLLEEMPQTLVEGFLYQRILNRVMNWQLKPVARDALVLRRITAEMIGVILGDNIPEGLDAEDVFARLTREFALVKGEEMDQGFQRGPALVFAEGGVLQLRPEVRSATLKLLETEDKERVQEIDKRAALWYAGQDLEEAVKAAELVYHSLRLGDIKTAEKAWRPDCALLLQYAVDDLSEEADAERAWLHERVGDVDEMPSDVEVWEADALERIRSSIGRRRSLALPPILNERSQRSANSPLLFYDAWVLWQDGELEEALAVLAGAGDIAGAPGRDRTVLAAYLAVLAGDKAEAQRLLRLVAAEEWWRDWRDGLLGLLAVQAALIQLTAELEDELLLDDLLRSEAGDPDDAPLLAALRQFLPLADMVLPMLKDQIEGELPFETVIATEGILIPEDVTEFDPFRRQLNKARQGTLVNPEALFLLLDSVDNPGDGAAELAEYLAESFPDANKEGLSLGKGVALSGQARWEMVSSNLFLSRACELAAEQKFDDFLQISIAGMLALFQGSGRNPSVLRWREQDLDIILDRMIDSLPGRESFSTHPYRVKLMAQILRRMGESDPFAAGVAERLEKMGEAPLPDSVESGSPIVEIPIMLLQSFMPQDLRGLSLYLLGVDPLKALVRQLFGLSGFR